MSTPDDVYGPFKAYEYTPSPDNFEEPTEDQQRDLDRLEQKHGKIVVTKKSLESNDPEDKVSLVEEASRTIMGWYNFVTVEETKDILYYKDGVYLTGGDIIIEKETEKICGFNLSNSQISEIKGHIMRRTYHKREEFDADINIINLKNGLYNREKNELTEHTPKYLSLNQKPIVYDKNARPKLFGKFLSQVLFSREIRTAIEAMAYTFHRDYELELIFILFGLGSNGKSVFTSVLTALHGKRNVSNVTVTQMLINRFAIADLENKDVNFDNEVIGSIRDTAILKRLTGGTKQPIRIERKGRQSYDTILHAKLFLNANKMPEIEELSNADSRRFVILTFPNEFDIDKADTKLISKLTTEEELSGIFNLLMVYLRKILENKNIHTNEKTIEERREKYERSMNPIISFIKEAVPENCTTSDWVEKDDFYKAYEKYCDRYGLPKEKKIPFGRIVKQLKPPEIDFYIKDDKVRVNGREVRCWIGILLNEEYIGKSEEITLENLS